MAEVAKRRESGRQGDVWMNCNATGCEREPAEGDEFCDAHWRQIPRGLRQVICQEKALAMKRPRRTLSKRWAAAVGVAVQVLKQLQAEG